MAAWKIAYSPRTPTSATFDGNIYANNLLSNNWWWTNTNVFVDGSMGGSWLANGTAPLAKLDTFCSY